MSVIRRIQVQLKFSQLLIGSMSQIEVQTAAPVKFLGQLKIRIGAVRYYQAWIQRSAFG